MNDPEESPAIAMLRALRLAQHALNFKPRFRIPYLSTDSYAVALAVDKAIAKAEKAGIDDSLPRPPPAGPSTPEI